MRGDGHQPLSLTRNFSWIFVGNVVYAISQWGILVVLAKLGTDVMLGIYTLGLALTAPVIFFTNLSLRKILVADMENQFNFDNYMSLRLFTCSVALLFFSVFPWFFGYSGEQAWIIFFIGLTKIFESISDITYGLFQKRERLDFIGKSLIIKAVSSLAVIILSLWITNSLLVGVAMLAIAWGVRLVWYDMQIARGLSNFRISLQRKTLIRLFRISYPLGIVAMLISLHPNIPRYFLEYHFSPEAVGYFSAIAYVMVAGEIVINALGESATPKMARTFNNGNIGGFMRLVLLMLVVCLVLGGAGVLMGIFFGEEVLTLLYHAEYIKLIEPFIVMMVAAGIAYLASMLGYVLNAARCYKIQPVLFTVVIVVSMITSQIFIPIGGIVGAGISIIVSMLVQLIGSALIMIYLIIAKQKQLSNRSTGERKEVDMKVSVHYE